jgi:hypothetical protein
MKQPKAKTRRPGYEPAKGNPDPLEAPPAVIPGVGYHTHMPQPTGTVCGVYPVPTNAKFYDPVAPTCPQCAAYLKATQRVTAARHPEAWAAAAAPTDPPPAGADK